MFSFVISCHIKHFIYFGIIFYEGYFYLIGREVVFQCRDEGPLRARVMWLRGNGLPLPPGSRNINGRLEMPNIQVTIFLKTTDNVLLKK